MQKWLHNLLTTAGHLAWKAWIHPQLLKEWREHSVLAKSLLKTSQKKFIRSLRKLFGTLECPLFHSFFGLKSPARVHGGRQTSKGLRGQHVGGSAPSTLSHPKSHRSLRVLYTTGMIETWNSASLPRSALVCQDTDDVLVPSFPLNDLGYTLSCQQNSKFHSLEHLKHLKTASKLLTMDSFSSESWEIQMFLAIQASACKISIGEITRKRIKKTASATWTVAQEKSKSEKHPRRPCFARVSS